MSFVCFLSVHVLIGTAMAPRLQLLKKVLCKYGLLERAKPILKLLLASRYLIYFFKRFGSFNPVNIGSVDLRVLKLLAVKVGGLKKKSANSALMAIVCASVFGRVRLCPKSNHYQILTDSNFAALCPTVPFICII